MDIFPGVLVAMYHIKLSLVDPNSSVDVSRRDRTKPSKPTEKFQHFYGDRAAGPTWKQPIPTHPAPPARYSGASAHIIRTHVKLGERHGLFSALNVFGHCTVSFNKLFYGSSYNICRNSRDQAPWACSASSAVPSTLTAFTHCPNSGTGIGSRKPKLGQSLLLFLHLWEVYRELRLESKSLQQGKYKSLRDAE